MSDQDTATLTLLGSNISYFTGKMENYLRLKRIPHRLESMQFPAVRKVLERELGVMQMPVIILPGGRYMTDSTAMIEWFEARHSEHSILPPDPLQRFVCHLLEDWAGEWWWRPAMHYRWHYADRAMQIFGGMGVCQDTMIPEVFTIGRFCRIADGPDEVHMSQSGKLTARELTA